MTHPKKPSATVTIGGKQVSYLRAAIMCREADRQNVPLSEVGEVLLPVPPPEHVEVAEKRLTVETAAMIAAEADEKGVPPGLVIAGILERHTRRDPSGRGKRRPPSKRTRK